MDECEAAMAWVACPCKRCQERGSSKHRPVVVHPPPPGPFCPTHPPSPHPTRSHLEPLRMMAPRRCMKEKGSMPGGTFWKALSGQLAKNLEIELPALAARGA